jgi:WD40 repeat protein
MSEIVIDKILGSSSLTSATLSVHYTSGAGAFVSHGFLSIILPKDSRRIDLEVCEDCREITCMTFSTTGEHLVLGESGSNARFFILTLSEDFSQILTKTEFRTKEVGFSCLALNSHKGRLITIGADAQPYFLLWDIAQARPSCIGCYHLAVRPLFLSFSSDGSLAYLCGPKLLKFVDCDIPPSMGIPAVLQCRNAAIGQFKTATFVATAITPDPPYSAYALTNDGLLCLIDSKSLPFGPNWRKTAAHKGGRIVIIPIQIDCKESTSLMLDRKIILVGTSTGAILAIKKEKDQHKVFGQFASEGKSVVAIGIAGGLSVAAYDDGHLIYWPRRINTAPLLAIPGHRGAVCGLFVLQESVLTCGSDSTVRVWKLQKTQTLIGKSSQEQVVSRVITKRAPDALTNLTGVRCVAAKDDLVFAGDFTGTVHVLQGDTLENIAQIVESYPGVICIAVHKSEPLVATGGGDGYIRVYTLTGRTLSVTLTKQVHTGPVTSIVFAQSGIVTTSSDGLRFCALPSGKTYATHKSTEPFLALAIVPSEKLVVAGGCDNCISLFRTADGSLFRKHKLSQSAYPLAIAIDKGGLFIATAMSDGQLQLLDLFSGDILFSVNSHAGVVTALHFHEGDLLLTSFSGPVMRFMLPTAVHTAMTERACENQPLLGLVLDSAHEEPATDAIVRGSLMKGGKPDADWIFREIHGERLQSGKPTSRDDAVEEEDEVDQGGFDGPRPTVAGEYETKVDDIVRMSFMRKKREAEASKRASSIVEEFSVPAREKRPPPPDPIREKRPPPPDPIREKRPPPEKKLPLKEDGDSFAVPSDKSLSVGETRADEMMSAAVTLKTAFDNAKRLLAARPSCPEEVAAQGTLREAFNSVRHEMVGNVGECKAEIRGLTEKILLTLQQLDA